MLSPKELEGLRSELRKAREIVKDAFTDTRSAGISTSGAGRGDPVVKNVCNRGAPLPMSWRFVSALASNTNRHKL